MFYILLISILFTSYKIINARKSISRCHTQQARNVALVGRKRNVVCPLASTSWTAGRTRTRDVSGSRLCACFPYRGARVLAGQSLHHWSSCIISSRREGSVVIALCAHGVILTTWLHNAVYCALTYAFITLWGQSDNTVWARCDTHAVRLTFVIWAIANSFPIPWPAPVTYYSIN